MSKIISNIDKLNLSVDDKIKMIDDKLSNLSSITFYGSLYIPNPSTSYNEDDKKELQSGGVLGTDEELKQFEKQEKDLNNKIAATKKTIESLRKAVSKVDVEIATKEAAVEAAVAAVAAAQDAETTKSAQDKLNLENNRLKKLNEKRTSKLAEIVEQESAKTKYESELKAVTLRIGEATSLRDIEQRNEVEARPLREAAAAAAAAAAERARIEKLCEDAVKPLKIIIENIDRLIARLKSETTNEKLNVVINKIEEEADKKISNYLNKYVKALLPESCSEGYTISTPVRDADFNFYRDKINLICENNRQLTRKLNDALRELGIVAASETLLPKGGGGSEGVYWWFYKIKTITPDWESRNINLIKTQVGKSIFHFTVHLKKKGIPMSMDFDKGPSHIVHETISDTRPPTKEKHDKDKVNMYPYRYTRLATMATGPQICMQLVPIYPRGDHSHTEIKVILVRVVNEYLFELQIKKYGESMRQEKRNTDLLDDKLSNLKRYLTANSHGIKKSIVKNKILDFIRKATALIRKMRIVRQIRKDMADYADCIEIINKLKQDLIISLAEVLNSKTEELTHLEQNELADQPNEDDLVEFETSVESKINLTELRSLRLEDQETPVDYQQLLTNINAIFSNDPLEAEAAAAEAEEEEEVVAEIPEQKRDGEFPVKFTEQEMAEQMRALKTMEYLNEHREDGPSGTEPLHPDPPAAAPAAVPPDPSISDRAPGKRRAKGGKRLNKITRKRLNKL